jgi:hypothetical protein
MWRLERIIRRINNLFRWLPVIWKDEQWDYYFIFEILKHKLTIMSDAIRKNGIHVSAKHDADRMILAIKLIERIQNEYYMSELINEGNLTKEKIEAAQAKHDKAKRILFKLLDQYIERWWD